MNEEGMAKWLEREGLEATNRFYSFYPGLCRVDLDPEKRGRIKVEVPVVSSRVLPTWALPMGQVAGTAAAPEGEVMVPKVGAPVLVMFQGGHPDRPYYMLGAPTMANKGTSAAAGPSSAVRSIESATVRIELDDMAGKLTIKAKPSGAEITASVTGIAQLLGLVVELGAAGLLPLDGVVTGACNCAFTGAPHPFFSAGVRARRT